MRRFEAIHLGLIVRKPEADVGHVAVLATVVGEQADEVAESAVIGRISTKDTTNKRQERRSTMSAISPTEDDVIFEDEYQRARRRRMLAAGVTANSEPTKVAVAPIHDRHVGTGITPKDAQGEPPQSETRAAEERPCVTLIRASDMTSSKVTRLRERAEVCAGQKLSRLEGAVAFLKRELAAGPTPARVIYERGARVGLSERTTDRAKSEAQIGSKRFKTDRGMQWFWYLPGREPSSLDQRVL